MVHCPFFLNEAAALPAKTIREDLVHDRMLEPVRRMSALVVNSNLEGRRHLRADLSQPPKMRRIIAIIQCLLLMGNNEIIP